MAAVFLCMTLTCGCTNRELKSLNSTITMSISDLPESYYQLSESSRKDLDVVVVLKPTEDYPDNKSAVFRLNEANGFSGTEYVTPGDYYVKSVDVVPDVSVPFGSNCTEDRSPVISAGRNNNTDFVLPIQEYQLYQTKQEILNEKSFSHKIQINDQIYNIEELFDKFTFNMDSPFECTMIQKKYNSYSCNEIKGLFVITSADDNTNKPVGVEINDSNIKLWGGMTAGDHITKLTNSKNGCIGTPSYCKGSPIVGLGHDGTTFVFVDPHSEAALQAKISTEDRTIASISYVVN